MKEKMLGGYSHQIVLMEADIYHFYCKKNQDIGGISIGVRQVYNFFLGTTSLKNINKNVRNQINYYNNDKNAQLWLGNWTTQKIILKRYS